MKTIYLLRHAKSSWNDASFPDLQRPLAPRGRKAAPRMGTHMTRHGLVPDRVLCSAARRAVETWQALALPLRDETPVEIREDLYHASPGTILEVLRELPAEVDSVLLIGHNPTLEELALALAGSGEQEALEDLERKYPTGAMAILDFPVQEWREVREGTGWLRAFIRPKDLQ